MTRPAEPKQRPNEFFERSSVSRTKIRQATRCRPIAELGQGGMASVYLAVNQSQAGVNKLVVFKALRPELASDPDVLAMFLDEARVAARLNHPNVVQTYEVGEYEGSNVLIMEYLEGQPLSRLIRECERLERPLPVRIGLQIINFVLEGLHYVHELHGFDGKPLELVHRDISPQNVFVTYDGQVKILDFGIAKAKDSSSQTAIGILKGKVAYMAPEQMTGGHVDRRADIYAVGCMLWALAVGEKLWHRVPDLQIMNSVLSGEIPVPTKVNPKIDPKLSAIICRALAARVEDRYQSARELQVELEAYCDSIGPSVKQSEIGGLVSELFAQTRAEIRSRIETQIASLDAIDSLPSIHLDDELSGRSGPKTYAETLVGPAPKKARFVPWFVMASLAALAVGYAGHRGMLRGFYPASGAAQGSASEAPATLVAPASAKTTATIAAAAPAPSAVALATVEFQVEPRGARLSLDGQPLPAGVKSRILPADASRHVLRAEAPNFQAAEFEFVVTRDTSIEVSLNKLGAASRKTASVRGLKGAASARPPASAEAPVTATAAAAPAPTPAPRRSCDDPFFIAEGGIKRVRPECM